MRMIIFIIYCLSMLIICICSCKCMESTTMPSPSPLRPYDTSFLIKDVHHDIIKKIINYSLTPYINHLSPHLEADDDQSCILTLNTLKKTEQLKCTLRLVCKQWDSLLLSYPIPKENCTAFFRHAVIHGKLFMARFLLKQGADINSPCLITDQHLCVINHTPPLFYAALNSDINMVAMLLEEGASKEACNTVTRKALSTIKHAQSDLYNPNKEAYTIIYKLLTETQ